MSTSSVRLLSLSVASLLLVGLAKAELVVVPANDPNGALTSVLAAGHTYLFVANGTYIYRDNYYWGDAEFSISPELPGEHEVYPHPLFSLEKDTLDLLVDLAAVDWLGSTDGNTWAPHTYSSDHVYRYYYTGAGSNVRLSISDWYPFYVYPGGNPYGDNLGSLSVEITEQVIPEPASLVVWCLLGALGMSVAWWRRRRAFSTR